MRIYLVCRYDGKPVGFKTCPEAARQYLEEQPFEPDDREWVELPLTADGIAMGAVKSEHLRGRGGPVGTVLEIVADAGLA